MSLIGKKVNIILFILLLNYFYNFSSLANLLANPDSREGDSPTLEDVAGILDGKDFNAEEKKVTIAGFKETSESLVKWNINAINTIKDVLLLYNHSALNNLNHTEINNSFWNDVKGVAKLAVHDGLNKASSKLIYSSIPLGSSIFDSYLFLVSTLSLLPEAIRMSPLSIPSQLFFDAYNSIKNKNTYPLTMVKINYQWLLEGQKIIDGFKSQDYETRTKAEWESLKYLYMMGLTFSPFMKLHGGTFKFSGAPLKKPIIKSVYYHSLKLIKKMGEGTKSKVYLVKNNNKLSALIIPKTLDKFVTEGENLTSDVLAQSQESIVRRFEYTKSIRDCNYKSLKIAPEVYGLVKNKVGKIIGHLEEVVAGKPLLELIRKNKLSAIQLNEILGQLKDQLDILHDHGFAHGDPLHINILVDLKSKGPKARFIDFAGEGEVAKNIMDDKVKFSLGTEKICRDELLKIKSQPPKLSMETVKESANKAYRNFRRFVDYQSKLFSYNTKTIPKEIYSYYKMKSYLEEVKRRLEKNDKLWIAQEIHKGKVQAKSEPPFTISQEDMAALMKMEPGEGNKLIEINPFDSSKVELYIPKQYSRIFQERWSTYRSSVNIHKITRLKFKKIYLDSLEE